MASNEQMPASKLHGEELEMYQKYSSRFPGASEDDFLEIRRIAKTATSPAAKRFFSGNGVIMLQEDLPSAEEIHDKFE